ncbi:MAG: hypothetical protein EBR82_59875 [Caulobacteraceae bacterium]|jgi:hypothetical protein|nr:hypothetical protein [Caulobacteraceae bacterium]
MSAVDWAGFVVALISIIGSVAIGIKWLVKHYLNELKPNGGSSLKDSVNRLERQVEEIYRILLTKRK